MELPLQPQPRLQRWASGNSPVVTLDQYQVRVEQKHGGLILPSAYFKNTEVPAYYQV